MTDIKATLDDRIERIMATMKGELPGLIRSGVLEAAQHAEGEIKSVLFGLPSKSGGRLYAEIANSYHAQFTEDDGKFVGAGAFSDHVAAKIQDEGGTIRPKQKKNLAIPISNRAKKTMMWPRHWGKTEGESQLRLIVNKNTNKVLLATVKGKGESAKLDVHYVLKSSVKITAKHYLQKALKRAEPGIEKIMGDHVAVAVKRGIEISE